MKRAECLRKAEACVCGQRQDDYGTPEDSFSAIAKLWSAYFDNAYEFDAVDVSMMMALLKIARIQTGTGTDDSFVDLAGYAACACEINEKKLLTVPRKP